MNIPKAVALCAITGTVAVVGLHAAHAQGAATCNNQINMANALTSLKSGRAALDRAEHDKGGWRVKAIEATDSALKETERGCAFADTH
jgi:hypothetical protein